MLERAAAPPISLLERIKRQLALFWCVGLLGLGTFLWTPVAALLRLVLPRRSGIASVAVARRFFAFYLANLRATGYARIDLDEIVPIEGERGIIVAANHPCLLDALLLLSRLPDGVPLMKSDLERSVFWGAPAHLAGYISNRNIMEAVRVARQRLHDGAQLVIFPRGRAPVPGRLDRCVAPLRSLRSGRGTGADRDHRNRLSVSLEGLAAVAVPPLPLHVRVRLGRRFEPPADAARFMVELREHFEQELAHAELRPSVSEPSE